MGKLLVGDFVTLQKENNSYVITKLEQRKNELIRPYIANVDQLVIVIAPTPSPDFLLTDKLIIMANENKLKTLLLLNKCDLFDEYFINKIKGQYENVVDDILILSAKNHLYIDELKEKLYNKFSVFAGQSAVGKSTILNELGFSQQTGELSKKVERGKHTTRQTEVFSLNDTTFIADTPGFSLLELFEVNPEKLHEYYPDIDNFLNNCKYRACNHIQMLESECAVKRAVTNGTLNKERYERYITLYEEVKKRWKEKYD